MGQVSLTTAEYNALIKENMELKSCFSVGKERYGNDLVLKTNVSKLLKVMPELIASVDMTDHTVRKSDDIYDQEVVIADRKPDEDQEE